MKISAGIRTLIQQALDEDRGTGDVTSLATIPARHRSCAEICLKQPGCVAGLEYVRYLFKFINAGLKVRILQDGRCYPRGAAICRLRGATRSILQGERTALNLLSRLSGIATATRRLVLCVRSSGARVLDTRKTTPLLREAEKYAVRMGGGGNHRMGLYDMVLIKENHVRAAGGIRSAVESVLRDQRACKLAVEVEVRDPAEFREARSCPGIHRILLDNMSPALIRRCVRLNRRLAGRAVPLEVSGGITPANAARYAATGVDYLSSGYITHSAPGLDMTLLIR